MSAESLCIDEDDGTMESETSLHRYQEVVPMAKSGIRLDQVAAEMFPEYSRSRLQQWIKEGCLRVDDRVVKPNIRLVGGEQLILEYVEQSRGAWLPESMPLDIIYEDDHILVVNKPPGLVVHPAAGNYSGTLLNGLIHHCPAQANLARAGIVHRLDKDTSGLMVVAKTESAQHRLVQQLQARSVSRQYRALVLGDIRQQGTVDAPIGRHPSQRTKMAVVHSGKQALTHYQPVTRFGDFTWVNLKLETGRTHQIRVHMAHLGLPLVGDPVYGRKLPAKLLRSQPVLQSLADFPRQALHAWKLGLVHPETEVACSWEVPIPEDLQCMLTLLRECYDSF